MRSLISFWGGAESLKHPTNLCMMLRHYNSVYHVEFSITVQPSNCHARQLNWWRNTASKASAETGEFPAQMASKNVSIWWRHHGSQRFWRYPGGHQHSYQRNHHASSWQHSVVIQTHNRRADYKTGLLLDWSSPQTPQSQFQVYKVVAVVSECNWGGLATGGLISDRDAWGTASFYTKSCQQRSI